MSLFLLPAGLAIGLILGLFGAGGGMATIPTIMVLMDVGIKEAIAMSLWVVALVSMTAALHQRVWLFVQWKMLFSLAVTGVLGSFLGTRLGMLLSEQTQLFMLAGLIFFVTWWMVGIRMESKVGVFQWIPALLVGFIIGILTGILGVGGGFLLVPALLYLGMKDFPVAVGHSLVLITLNAFVGALSYMNTVPVAIEPTLMIAAVAAVGAVGGGILLKRLAANKLQQAFAVLLFCLGCWVIWKAVA